MNHRELILEAAAVIRPRPVKGGLIGDVGCALRSSDGHLYRGTCIASGSNVICAEQAAIGAMVTAGEYTIDTIVAVWKDEAGKMFVIAPCGNCRQFMFEIAQANLEAQVVLDSDRSVPLRELLPNCRVWNAQE